MLSFKSFLAERFKSSHEAKIRTIASKARQEWMETHAQTHGLHVDEPEKKMHKGSFSQFGDCDALAAHVHKALVPHYKSAKVVNGNFYGKTTSGMHDDEGMSGHAWVEIPEIGHYVDPSHDQFRAYPRKDMPQVKGNYPDNAIRIGKMNNQNYRQDKNYRGYGYRPNTHPGSKNVLGREPWEWD